MTILATIVVLGVLIFVHELGHFMAAKSVGIDVQRFSIGFPPTMFSFRRGETEYVIGWVPLGGYVKMGGMDDEVMERIEGGAVEDDEPDAGEGAEDGAVKEARKPKPTDFDGKPIWARTWVISAGVIMNILFAFVVYTGVNAVWGLEEIPENLVGRVWPELLPSGAEALAELPAGARLIAVGDRQVADWREVLNGFMEAPAGPLTIVTDQPGLEVEIDVTSDLQARAEILGGFTYWIDAEVGDVTPGSPAETGGLEAGDRVLVAGGLPITNWHDFVDVIEARPDMRTELSLERNGQSITRFVTPEPTMQDDPVTGERVSVGKVGIYRRVDRRDISMAQAVRLGYAETVGMTGLILDFLRQLVTGGVSPRSLGSIVTIGAASGEAAERGMDFFLRFMAFFSVNLAVLNLLPIPILDGGHLVFLGIEAVRGKALSIEQRLRWSHVGFVIIMGIMLLALSNDILRLFGI